MFHDRSYQTFIFSLVASGWLLSVIAPPVEASCGSVSCFVVIGSQQQVPMAGLLTVNAIYNYTPMEAPSGQGGSIPFANQGDQTLTLANLNVSQIRTLMRTATLDMNYGLTERFGLQVTLPYKHVTSDAQVGGINPVPYSDKGLGDIRVALKYNVLPTLRSMIVLGMGVDLPTGDYGQRVQGGSLAESTLQIGRGNFGIVPTIYQSYELIPHRLNQFALASYRHTFKNSDGYQFGDEVNLSAGLNIIPLESSPWLVLTQQVNYRWMQNDAMDAALFQFNPGGADILLGSDGQASSGSHDWFNLCGLFSRHHAESLELCVVLCHCADSRVSRFQRQPRTTDQLCIRAHQIVPVAQWVVRGDRYMIGMFLQMWSASRRGRFSHAIAGVCVTLWLAGSVSTLYGSLTPQWTTPHCPQSHSNSAQHTHGSCAWHCAGIETQSASGRSWGPSITPTGYSFGDSTAPVCTLILQDGKAIRGPPHSIVLNWP